MYWKNMYLNRILRNKGFCPDVHRFDFVPADQAEDNCKSKFK